VSIGVSGKVFWEQLHTGSWSFAVEARKGAGQLVKVLRVMVDNGDPVGRVGNIKCKGGPVYRNCNGLECSLCMKTYESVVVHSLIYFCNSLHFPFQQACHLSANTLFTYALHMTKPKPYCAMAFWPKVFRRH
jgi:hypothetical protein